MMDIRDVGLTLIMIIAFGGLVFWACIRISAKRDAERMWSEALADKSGRKMRAIEKWLKNGPPPH